jgi:integrase
MATGARRERQQWRVKWARRGQPLTVWSRWSAKAGVNGAVSPHWLRHAHGSHTIDRGASLPEVQSTLGYGNIATTSGYLRARPDTSGLHLDPGVFLR